MAHAEDGQLLTKIKIRGIEVHAITEDQCVNHISFQLNKRQGGWVATPNLDHLRRLETDKQFSSVYETADLVVSDGMPLVWASRLQGTPLPERVAGSSLISSLSRKAADNGQSVFLLGGNPGSANNAADVLRSRFPHLRIMGTYCPPPDFRRSRLEYKKITRVLQEAKPDIVFVALGSPKQEELIHMMTVKKVLPSAWWLGVGISFSFLCGEVTRASKKWQNSGFEWLHRLFQEPGRLTKRYLVEGLPFAVFLFTQSAIQGLRFRFKRVVL